MNIKISNNALRFRLTKKEFLSLMAQEDIVVDSLPKISAKYVVKSSSQIQGMEIKVDESAVITLMVGTNILEDFAQKLPSRDGIEQEFLIDGKSIKLTLEVDLKKRG